MYKPKDPKPYEEDEIFKKFTPDAEFSLLLKNIDEKLRSFEKNQKKKQEKEKVKEIPVKNPKDSKNKKNPDKNEEKPKEIKKKKEVDSKITEVRKKLKETPKKKDPLAKIDTSSASESPDVKKKPEKPKKTRDSSPEEEKKPKKLKDSKKKQKSSSDDEKAPKKPKKKKDRSPKDEKDSDENEKNQEEKEENPLPEEFQAEGKLTSKQIKIMERHSEKFKKMNIDKNQFFVSERKSLKSKRAEYQKASILKNIDKAYENYGVYRAVKGDGNCAYRSIIYLYLEQVLYEVRKKKHLTENKAIKNFFKMIFKTEFKVDINQTRQDDEVKYEALHEGDGKLLKKYMIYKLNEFLIESFKTPKEKKKEFSIRLTKLINDNPLLDFAIIAMVRTLLGDYYLKNEEKYKVYMEEGKSLERMIREMDLEGEMTVITALAEFLKIKIKIVNIEDQFYEVTANEESVEATETIHLYYRPGHYDCLYKEADDVKDKGEKAEKEKEQQEWKYYEEMMKNDHAGKRGEHKIFDEDNKQNFCHKCQEKNRKVIKSSGCDHSFCAQCLMASNQFDKSTINCLVCPSEMMSKANFNKFLQEN